MCLAKRKPIQVHKSLQEKNKLPLKWKLHFSLRFFYDSYCQVPTREQKLRSALKGWKHTPNRHSTLIPNRNCSHVVKYIQTRHNVLPDKKLTGQLKLIYILLHINIINITNIKNYYSNTFNIFFATV